ncbi:hypothetical protein FRC02_006158, partial [Tulasnella sp. 418]
MMERTAIPVSVLGSVSQLNGIWYRKKNEHGPATLSNTLSIIQVPANMIHLSTTISCTQLREVAHSGGIGV